MQHVKRALKGSYVQADVTGTGDWEVGHIVDFDDRTITFVAASDGKPVRQVRGEVFKAKKAEYEAALAASTPTAADQKKARSESNEALDELVENMEHDQENDQENDDEEPVAQRSIVKKHYKERYGSAQNCGDLVALKLQDAELDEVYEAVANELGLDREELEARYEHLNFGGQRMVLGNRLRAYYKKHGLMDQDEEA